MSDPHVSYLPDKDFGRIIYEDENGAVIVHQELQFQHGPVSINGVNGVQNEDVLTLVCLRLRSLNERMPCRENSLAITKIEEAQFWMEHRTRLRKEQGVEGKAVKHIS